MSPNVVMAGGYETVNNLAIRVWEKSCGAAVGNGHATAARDACGTASRQHGRQQPRLCAPRLRRPLPRHPHRGGETTQCACGSVRRGLPPGAVGLAGRQAICRTPTLLPWAHRPGLRLPDTYEAWRDIDPKTIDIAGRVISIGRQVSPSCLDLSLRLHSVGRFEVMSGVSHQRRVRGMIDRLDTREIFDQFGMVAVQVLYQLGFGVRRTG